MRTVYDAHVHLADCTGPRYDFPVVGRNVIFNVLGEYQEHRGELEESDAVSVICPLNARDEHFVADEIRAGRVHALKVHSRIQKLTAEDWPKVTQVARRFPNVPLIVDAFYYGSDLAHQPSLPGIIAIAQDSPERPVIVAHCGGYRLLEYFFHLRDLPNIWYDLSFSLQYLSDSSLRSDLIKLIRYTSPDRLMFGSDFPFASAARQCDVLIGLAREAGVRDDGLDRMLATNARDLFGGVVA